MADLSNFDFNVTDLNAKIPAGSYPVEIVGSSVKADEDKVRLGLQVVVLEGEYEGRKFFLDFWLRHPSEKARSMSIRNFKSLVKACGFESVPGDTTELHGGCFVAKVDYYQDKFLNLRESKPFTQGTPSEDSPF